MAEGLTAGKSVEGSDSVWRVMIRLVCEVRLVMVHGNWEQEEEEEEEVVVVVVEWRMGETRR